MKKIRIAQIGTSRYSHGGEIFDTLLRNSDVFDVVGYALPENEREKFPEKMRLFRDLPELTVDEILNDPSIEAVTVETEEIYLTKYALMAAKAKKHIHMEKPGGAIREEFEELISTVKKNGTVLHIGYMYRYNPCLIDIINRIKGGEIGDVISVEAHMSSLRDIEHTSWLSSFKGGMMFYLGCHLIDLVLRIKGLPKCIIPINRSSGLYDCEGIDNSFALFEYETGASFVKTTQAEYGGFDRRQLVITGTKGKFEIRPLEIMLEYPFMQTAYVKCSDPDFCDSGKRFISEPFERYTDMMRAFYKMASGQEENPFTPDYELTLHNTLLLACGE